MKVFVSSGGGMAIGATFGAEHAGEKAGKFKPLEFDYYAGTSAGALDAILTANGWTARQKINLFVDTDMAKFLTPFFVPFGVRKLAATLNMPIKLDRLAKFFDSLTQPNPFGPALMPHTRVLINSVDSKNNIHTVFCEEIPIHIKYRTESAGSEIFKLSHGGRIRWIDKAFTSPEWGIGKVLCCSMALPGLKPSPDWMRDGGFAQNPLLSIWPSDAQILMMDLGYSGLVEKHGKDFPVEMIDQVLYGLEFCQNEAKHDLVAEYPRLQSINPRAYSVDRTKFNMHYIDKLVMVHDGETRTVEQWDHLH